jgi:hypothetical protein
VLVPLGEQADRVLLAVTVASFVALVAGLYRLGRAAFTPLVGALAALILLSRLDFPFFAARGYVDIPYLALVTWAAALEAERPRRGGVVWVLLALGGLLRPEAWVLAGLYAVWLGWSATWARRARLVAYAAVAPLLWAAVDLIVTGDPMFSLNYTTRSAALLGRRQTIPELPGVTIRFLSQLTKWPVLAAGGVGIVLALRFARDRVWVPLVMLVSGVATFLAVSVRGFSVINRYLLFAVLAVMVFAAFTLGGFQSLPRGTSARRAWTVGSVVLLAVAALWSATHFNTRYIDGELKLRQNVRTDLERLFAAPAVVRARRCGPVAVPNHKLIADLRWILDAGQGEVLARSNPANAGRYRRGVEVFVTGRLIKHPAYGPFDQDEDSGLTQVPSPGYERAAVGRYFSAYVRC